jgi:hypothetical protein
MLPITIKGVWLMRHGGENDPRAQAEVHVETDEGWRKVIVEPLNANFSHAVSPDGIRNSPASDFAADAPVT